MPFACYLLLFQEKQAMHASQVSMVSSGTGQPKCSCMKLLNCLRKMCIFGWDLGWLPRIFAQFRGRAANCCPDLHKFWVEQPCWGNLRNFHWECWLAELRNSGAQQVTKQDCAIFGVKAAIPLEMCNFLGELLNLQLDQVRVINLWGECIKLWSTCCLYARKTLKLVYLTKQDKVL